MIPDSVAPQLHIVKSYNVHFPEIDDWSRSDNFFSPSDYVLFTDDSKRENGVGAVVYGINPRTEMITIHGD